MLPALIFSQSTHPRASHIQPRMVRAVDLIAREGAHAQLPPHVSTLLGLTIEKECPVMQRAMRTGDLVQGFNVSTANENDVIIFTVNEKKKDQTLYLTSAAGRLRRVVVVEAGVGRVGRITEQNRKDFEKEKQLWLERLAPARTPQAPAKSPAHQ